MDNEAFANNSSKFTYELYKEITTAKSNENVIFSPFSIQTCLALAFVAAKGKTADELQSGLHLGSPDVAVVSKQFKSILDNYQNNPVLKIANKIYVSHSCKLNSEFSEVTTKNFHSEAENIDFGQNNDAAKTINRWVEAKTNEKIKDLVSPDSLDSRTTAVLINAIHFKGLWIKPFRKEGTYKEDFWISEETSVPVDMMHAKEKYHYGVFEALDATSIKLPYQDTDLSMLVILPKKREGLKDLESKLQSVNLKTFTEEMTKETVVLKLPKFRIEFEIELNEPLEKLGMGTMFSDGADFGNLLATNQPLKISKVIHKAFIEVNEEGTEAAAATRATMMLRCALIDPVEFNFFADHPFLYLIMDENNHIYFIGKYLLP